MINSTPQAVTIAGSDSGGGAGIQADLKTFQARSVFGMSIIVALTAQNTKGVQDAYFVPTEFIDAQFDSLVDDFKIGACKTGMLASEAHVKCVVENLKKVDFGPYILDPVMIAKGGHKLLEDESFWLSGKRIDTNRTHGTGDTFAACITSELAKGETLRDSIITAKKFIQGAVQYGIQVGHGHGPLNHWVELEDDIKIIE